VCVLEPVALFGLDRLSQDGGRSIFGIILVIVSDNRTHPKGCALRFGVAFVIPSPARRTDETQQAPENLAVPGACPHRRGDGGVQ